MLMLIAILAALGIPIAIAASRSAQLPVKDPRIDPGARKQSSIVGPHAQGVVGPGIHTDFTTQLQKVRDDDAAKDAQNTKDTETKFVDYATYIGQRETAKWFVENVFPAIKWIVENVFHESIAAGGDIVMTEYSDDAIDDANTVIRMFNHKGWVPVTPLAFGIRPKVGALTYRDDMLKLFNFLNQGTEVGPWKLHGFDRDAFVKGWRAIGAATVRNVPKGDALPTLRDTFTALITPPSRWHMNHGTMDVFMSFGGGGNVCGSGFPFSYAYNMVPQFQTGPIISKDKQYQWDDGVHTWEQAIDNDPTVKWLLALACANAGQPQASLEAIWTTMLPWAQQYFYDFSTRFPGLESCYHPVNLLDTYQAIRAKLPS